jgi:hypothetical protein
MLLSCHLLRQAANDPDLLPSFMGEPTVRILHMSWANRRRPNTEILPMFMGEPMSVRRYILSHAGVWR